MTTGPCWMLSSSLAGGERLCEKIPRKRSTRCEGEDCRGELGLFYLQESLEGVPGPVRVLPKEEAQV